MNKITWHHGHHFEVGDIKFQYCDNWENMHTYAHSEGYVVAKTEEMLRITADLIEQLSPKNIMELGVFRGGSAILFHQLCQPDNMLTIDIGPSVNTLESYKNQLQDNSLSTVYEISQSDPIRIPLAIQQRFGSTPIDLVIDDASHDYEHTLKSLNLIFPYMRPGGYYIIEDWAWGYHTYSMPEEYVQQTSPLTRLAFELVTLAGLAPKIIEDLTVNKHHLILKRGSAKLTPESFDYRSFVDLTPETYLASSPGITPQTSPKQ
jgi:cephalosporin hydroxylase